MIKNEVSSEYSKIATNLVIHVTNFAKDCSFAPTLSSVEEISNEEDNAKLNTILIQPGREYRLTKAMIS
jgi:glutathione peroxidase-family protein